MRLIDADALINTLGVSDEDIDFREIIGDAPTIDAVPVVRCKDCKYRGIIDYPVCCESTDEWFCADGDRRRR